MVRDRRSVDRLASRARRIRVLCGALLVVSVVCGAAADAPDLSGTWAMIQFLPEIGDLPFVGETSITAVVGVLVHVEQTGSSVAMRDTYCHTDVLSNTTLITSRVPDRVMVSLRPAPRTATLSHRAGRWTLEQDPHLEIRGARLENPADDPLPVGTWDSRVFDLDEDGNPGFTVPVSVFGIVSGDTYVVQRLAYTISSDDVEADGFDGSIEWSSEQVVIGGTDAILMTTFEQWHHPDPARHRFVMRRLDDGATCDDVLTIFEEEREAYLQAFPPTATSTTDV